MLTEMGKLRKKVRTYRDVHGITYYDMALDIGCSYATLINFVKGKTLKPYTLDKVEKFFEEPVTLFERIKMMNLSEMTGFLLDFKNLTSNNIDFLDVKKKLLERVGRRKYVRKS